MTDSPLPALIVRWLTHDFASPIATILTASELLSDKDADAEINGLVTEAAQRLAARLRLVRTALAPGEAEVGNAALEKLVGAGIDATPLIWQRRDTDATPAALVAATALLAADLRRGSPLTVTDTGAHWPTPFELPPAVTAVFTGGAASDGRSALAALVVAAAARAGRRLTAAPNGFAWT